MITRLLASALALALFVVPVLAGKPSPATLRVDRAPAPGQPAAVCIDVTSATCAAIGTMSPNGAFFPSLPRNSVPLAALPYAPAKSGANADITSLTGLATALSLRQGGTGATTPAAALAALGAVPLAGGVMRGLLTLPSLQTTATSPAPVNFNGSTQYNSIASTLTSTRANAAEAAGYFSIVSKLGANNFNYKAALVGIAQVLPGGGSGYGGNLVCSLAAGLPNSSTAICRGMEVDEINNDAGRAGNAWSGSNWAGGILVSGNGKYQSNSGLEITSGNAGAPGNTNSLWEVGLRFSQPSLAVASISGSSIQDETTSGTSYNDFGMHTFGLGLNGTYTTAAIDLAGVYGVSAKPLIFPGGYIDAKGTIAAVSYTETLTTPTSSRAACKAGQFTDDANYHYVCVSANRWKRVALSAF